MSQFLQRQSAIIAFVAATFRARRSGDIFARNSLNFLRPSRAAFLAAFVTFLSHRVRVEIFVVQAAARLPSARERCPLRERAQFPARMHDSDHLDRVRIDAIDQPVGRFDQFA